MAIPFPRESEDRIKSMMDLCGEVFRKSAIVGLPEMWGFAMMFVLACERVGIEPREMLDAVLASKALVDSHTASA